MEDQRLERELLGETGDRKEGPLLPVLVRRAIRVSSGLLGESWPTLLYNIQSCSEERQEGGIVQALWWSCLCQPSEGHPGCRLGCVSAGELLGVWPVAPT